jgi:molybdopterin synthase sulfur carrier subunit
MVSVQIFGQTLRAVVEESELEVPVTGPTTVKQLIEAHPTQLGPLRRYMTSREALITINKKVGSEDCGTATLSNCHSNPARPTTATETFLPDQWQLCRQVPHLATPKGVAFR